MTMKDHQGWKQWAGWAGGLWRGWPDLRQHPFPAHLLTGDLTYLLSQGAMAATYLALNSSKPTPQLKPIESSILAQRRVRKLPSTTL